MVRYGPVVAVGGVSFTAEPGEVLALLGPNGAGKTTTVETLEGFRWPTAGTVRVLGLDPDDDHDRLTPQMGVMLQDGGVHPGIKPLEILRLLAAFYPDADDPVALLDRVGLAHRAQMVWRKLSGGEQQRLSLAMALIGRPKVVFLDEPTARIDVSGRQVVRQIIDELRAGGVCVLVTTHDLEEAEKIADRVIIIDQGRIVARGTPSELMRSGGNAEIRFGAPPGLDVAAMGKAMMAAIDEVSPGEYCVHVEATPANVATLTAWLAERDLPLADLRAGRQRLEDIFVRLTSITGEIPVIKVSDRDGSGASRGGRQGAA